MIKLKEHCSIVLIPILLASAAPRAMPAPPATERPLIGVYGGTSNSALQQAIERGVDVLFPSVYWYEDNAFLTTSIERAHEAGIQVYPSLAAAYDGYGDKRHPFAEEHPELWEKRRDGSILDRGEQVNLSWIHPQVRAFKVRTMTELVRRSGADGVLLDYCRYFGNNTGYCDAMIEAFREAHGVDPRTLPDDEPRWIAFRAALVTDFVGELRRSLHALNPRLRILACVNPEPEECLHNAMQDWRGWVQRGLVDGVVTMIYERDTNNTLRRIAIANEAIAGKVPHMPMIAPYGGNLVTPAMLKDAAYKSLASATGGVAFYRADSIEQLQLWPALGDITEWDMKQVRRDRVNFVLNPRFENGLEHYAIGEGGGIRVIDLDPPADRKALAITLAGTARVDQIIDRGWFPGFSGLEVTVDCKQIDIAPDAGLFLQVLVVKQDGRHRIYRVPIPPGDHPPGNTSVSLPIGRSERLRFVILSIIARASAGELRIHELTARLRESAPGDPEKYLLKDADPPAGEAGRANLARGRIVRGSSFWENGFDYDNAVDGDLSSADYGRGAAWHSQRPARDQWITVYLTDRHPLRMIRLLNASAMSAYRTRDYRVEVSLDDLHYTTIAEGVLPDDGETWTEIPLDGVPARYVRFVGVTGYNLEYATGLKEIEIY